MSIKLADSLEPMTQGFPAAFASKIWMDKNKGEGNPEYKDIQEMYNDDELGGGGSSSDNRALAVAMSAAMMAQKAESLGMASLDKITSSNLFLERSKIYDNSLRPSDWMIRFDFVSDSNEDIFWKLYNIYSYTQEVFFGTGGWQTPRAVIDDYGEDLSKTITISLDNSENNDVSMTLNLLSTDELSSYVITAHLLIDSDGKCSYEVIRPTLMSSVRLRYKQEDEIPVDINI